jgi:hypothetical protein
MAEAPDPVAQRATNKFLRESELQILRIDELLGPGPAISSEDLTLEEMMSLSLGPVVKEGFVSRRKDNLRASGTLDVPQMPSPDFLLPPVREGVNVFGLKPSARRFQRMGPPSTFDSSGFVLGGADQLRAKLLPKVKKQIENLTFREIILGLMDAGWEAEELEGQRKDVEAGIKAKDPGFSKTVLEDFRGLFAQVILGDLIGITFKGRSP